VIPVVFRLADIPKSRWSDFYTYTGKNLFDSKNFEEAKSQFSNAIDKNKKNGEAFYFRAQCHFESNDRENGCKDLIRAQKLGIQLSPQDQNRECGKK